MKAFLYDLSFFPERSKPFRSSKTNQFLPTFTLNEIQDDKETYTCFAFTCFM